MYDSSIFIGICIVLFHQKGGEHAVHFPVLLILLQANYLTKSHPFYQTISVEKTWVLVMSFYCWDIDQLTCSRSFTFESKPFFNQSKCGINSLLLSNGFLWRMSCSSKVSLCLKMRNLTPVYTWHNIMQTDHPSYQPGLTP